MFGQKYLYPILIILILASGIFFRFWQLGTVPPGVHYDEAYNGMNALWSIEKGDKQVFYSENTGREGFHINVISYFIDIFGNSNWGLRAANALWGSFTIIGFFLLLRVLGFSRLAVILGTFALAFSFWHIVFSRTAYRAIMVPFVLIWSFFFFWKGLKSSSYKWVYFSLSGLFLGLGFHTYIAFRIAPIIMLLTVLSFLFTEKNFFKLYWKSALLFLIVFLLVSLPIFIYFSHNFKELVFRSDSVSIFNSSGLTFGQALKRSLSAHLSAFFVFGDHNPRHNYNDQPLLPQAWAVFFALGFLITFIEIVKTVKNRVKKEFDETSNNRWFHISVLAQSMFWIMILPGVLSIEGIPHSLRIIGVIPAVFIMITLAMEYLLNLKDSIGKINRDLAGKLNLFILGLVVLILFGGFSQTYLYFSKWSSDVRTEGAYERRLYNLGLLIRGLPVHKNNYIITSFNANVTADHKQSSLKTTEFVGYPNSQKYAFYLPMSGINQVSCEETLIVFHESDQWLRDQYRDKCPNLRQKRYSYDNGKYLYWVMAADIDNL